MVQCNSSDCLGKDGMIPQTLIIGYGNTLRGDDGVGQVVAEHIEALHWPHCQVLSVHQLTPELAAAIAGVDRVIFIDAYLAHADPSPPLRIDPLEPTLQTDEFGHRSSPTDLLALTKTLYDKNVTAWQVLIPAIDTAFGETLSSLTEQAGKMALATIQQLVHGDPPEKQKSPD